jgi:hypothetical protein
MKNHRLDVAVRVVLLRSRYQHYAHKTSEMEKMFHHHSLGLEISKK